VLEINLAVQSNIVHLDIIGASISADVSVIRSNVHQNHVNLDIFGILNSVNVPELIVYKESVQQDKNSTSYYVNVNQIVL
jgi:hypothetical protein